MSTTIPVAELATLCAAALEAAGASTDNARVVGEALAAAEADGLASHGASRLPFYASQLMSGKVDGRAVPSVVRSATACVHVDARDGFAYPAIRAGLDAALGFVRETGTAAVAIGNSHHAGAAGHHVEYAARHGVVALGFSNSPAGIAPWGGRRGVFGTNPIAFACPRRPPHPPLVIDLSLSAVARGKVMQAKQRGESIPEGWAIDADGNPTTDPETALAGTMLPIGGAKGSALALMVEVLTAVLTGSNLAFEASSFFTAEGPPPRIAQSFMLLDPEAFAGPHYDNRIETLVGAVLGNEGCRLPGGRREEVRTRSLADGVAVPESLLAEIRSFAG